MGRKRTQPPHPQDQLFGVAVLAAGASSRLGRPKQLLSYRGRPLLRHVAEQAVASRAGRVMVVLGYRADEISPALDGLDLQAARNPEWSEGAASSVRLAVRRGMSEDPPWSGVLFLTCDQPAVTTNHLDQILKLAAPHRIVASRYGETLGVPAFFGERFYPELLRLEGDSGAKKIILRHPDDTLEVALARGHLDIDGPADLVYLKKGKSK